MDSRARGAVSGLSLAIGIALALAACGGGGGGQRSDPPPPPPPSPPPTAQPPVVQPPNPDFSHHLSWTGADAAHALGLTGKGIRIGVVDSGIHRNHPALAGRVLRNLTYISGSTNNLAVDDVVGHGTAVAQVIGGKPFGQWPGGIAPGVEFVSARIINDKRPDDDGSGQGNEVSGALGLAPIHRDLIDAGVRIMNNSWGGLYWTNPAATAPIAEEYRPFIAGNGGLVVFSTGNSGFANPSSMAALPSQAGTGGSRPAADLERGWLAVAALSGSDPTRLAAYSNACGEAMHYCLAAPGTVVVTGTSDAPNAPLYYEWQGTSFSAPIVSGAAALVWEAFPYFDNDLVRQTLLGTATDLGAAGVDPVFGYGALDIAAAVRGPARLDWGDVTVDFDGITSVWSNEISGAGALVKDGTGTLVVDADMTIGGGIVVRDGVFQAEQTVFGDVRVEPQGTYHFGTHVLGLNLEGDLDNAGRVGLVSHGSSLMTVSLMGDYRHRPGATLAFDLGQSLSVGGVATIEGGTLHLTGIKPGYVATGRELLLSTGEGIEGRFGQFTWASSLFLDGKLDYGELELWLDINRLDVTAAARKMARMSPAGLSAAQRVEATFAGIDRAMAAGGAAAEDVVDVAGAFQRIADESQALVALESLSGASHALATTLGFDTVDLGRRALSSRWSALEAGVEGMGVWKQALGQGSGNGIAGGGFALDGWMMGRDQSLAGAMAMGMAFGESRAEHRLGSSGERSRDRQTRASLYAGRLFEDGYAMAHASAGRFDRDIERRVYAGDAPRTGVFGQYAGRYSSLGLEAGREYRPSGGLALTSYLGLDHTQLEGDDFREWGSNFALQARASRMQRSQAIAGVRAEGRWRGATLRAYGEWQQVLSARGFEVEASFIGIDSWSPLPVADAARSGGVFGVAMEAGLSRRTGLLLSLDQRFGPRGDERMGSLRYVYGF